MTLQNAFKILLGIIVTSPRCYVEASMWSIDKRAEGWGLLQGFLLLYVDPGGGSILLQALIGALLAIWLFLRAQRERVRHFFRNRFSRVNTEHDEHQAETR